MWIVWVDYLTNDFFHNFLQNVSSIENECKNTESLYHQAHGYLHNNVLFQIWNERNFSMKYTEVGS